MVIRGGYRQLCGRNYFNSDLQFLQAEKNIRIRSLVKMGFLISEIKDIFKDWWDAKEHDIELMIWSSDEAIVFYTAGAV